MKKILLAGLLASSMFYNVACDSGDVAAGAIGVGIGIGLGGLDNHGGDNRYDHGGRYGRGDYDRGGYGRGGYNRGCNQYRCYNAASTEGTVDANLVAELTTSTFAQKHKITEAAGVKIQKAFANVSQSGLASFQAIGLNAKAVDKIMSRELPDDASIQAMGQKLDISANQSRDLLQNLVTEFQTEASNSQSNYWQSCQAKGQWKTPQNAYCTDASWNGCSPDTGATLCY